MIDQCHCHEIDYARRNRDNLIEIDPFFSKEKFKTLKREFQTLDEEAQIEVFADFHLSDGIRPRVASTIGREIMYAYDHAVHHLAIVKIGIQSLEADIPIHENMGVAASTIQHQYEINHGH